MSKHFEVGQSCIINDNYYDSDFHGMGGVVMQIDEGCCLVEYFNFKHWVSNNCLDYKYNFSEEEIIEAFYNIYEGDKEKYKIINKNCHFPLSEVGVVRRFGNIILNELLQMRIYARDM